MSLAEDLQLRWRQTNEWMGRIQFARHLMICIRLYESFHCRSSNYLFFSMINSNEKYNWISGVVFSSFESKQYSVLPIHSQSFRINCIVVVVAVLHFFRFIQSVCSRQTFERQKPLQASRYEAERSASKCSLHLKIFDYFWRSNQVGCALSSHLGHLFGNTFCYAHQVPERNCIPVLTFWTTRMR